LCLKTRITAPERRAPRTSEAWFNSSLRIKQPWHNAHQTCSCCHKNYTLKKWDNATKYDDKDAKYTIHIPYMSSADEFHSFTCAHIHRYTHAHCTYIHSSENENSGHCISNHIRTHLSKIINARTVSAKSAHNTLEKPVFSFRRHTTLFN